MSETIKGRSNMFNYGLLFRILITQDQIITESRLKDFDDRKIVNHKWGNWYAQRLVFITGSHKMERLRRLRIYILPKPIPLNKVNKIMQGKKRNLQKNLDDKNERTNLLYSTQCEAQEVRGSNNNGDGRCGSMAPPSAAAIFFNLNLVSKSRVNSLGFSISSSNGLLPMCGEFARKRFCIRFSTGTHEKEKEKIVNEKKVVCCCYRRILHQHLSAVIVLTSSQFSHPDEPTYNDGA